MFVEYQGYAKTKGYGTFNHNIKKMKNIFILTHEWGIYTLLEREGEGEDVILKNKIKYVIRKRFNYIFLSLKF